VVCRFVCAYVWCVKQKATFFATGHASFRAGVKTCSPLEYHALLSPHVHMVVEDARISETGLLLLGAREGGRHYVWWEGGGPGVCPY